MTWGNKTDSVVFFRRSGQVLVGTQVTSVVFADQEICKGPASWRDAYQAIVKFLYRLYPSNVRWLRVNQRTRAQRSASDFVQIDTDLWIDINYTPSGIVQRIDGLLVRCHLPLSMIQIFYASVPTVGSAGNDLVLAGADSEDKNLFVTEVEQVGNSSASASSKAVGLATIAADADELNMQPELLDFDDDPTAGRASVNLIEKMLVDGEAVDAVVAEQFGSKLLAGENPVLSADQDNASMVDIPKEHEFTLESVPDVSFCKPVSFVFSKGKPVNVTSWAELYTEVLRSLDVNAILRLKDKWGTSFFAADGESMIRPSEVCHGVFVEQNRSAAVLLNYLRKFFDYLNFDPSSLVVDYRNAGLISAVSAETVNAAASEPDTEVGVMVADSLVSKVEEVPEYVDFTDPVDLAYTVPVKVCYFEEDLGQVSSWKDAYACLMRVLYSDYSHVIPIGQSFTGVGRIDLAREDGLATMLAPREVAAGVYLETNLSAERTVHKIRAVLDICNVDYENVVIEFERRGRSSAASQVDNSVCVNEGTEVTVLCTGSSESERLGDKAGSDLVPASVETESPIASDVDVLIPPYLRDAIISNYKTGMRFDDTVLSVLNSLCNGQVSFQMWERLRTAMFQRRDNLCFLAEQIADESTLQSIKNNILEWLGEYPLCEVPKVYECVCNDFKIANIRGSEDFADLLKCIMPNDVRVNNAFSSSIVRLARYKKYEVLQKFTELVIDTIHGGGCITEDELLEKYPVVSADFLRKLIEDNPVDVVPTEINGLQCYQTMDAMGFDESFSNLLDTILEQARSLELSPSLDTLHTLLSLEAHQNFRKEFGIPDDNAFRRIIAKYYRGDTLRKWKSGCFMEEDISDV